MKKLFLFAATILCFSHLSAAEKAPLTLDVYNAGANSFRVNATLVYGEKEAVLIDTGFTKADALRIAAKVFDSGKELKTIFISQADPDYYFGAEVIQALFPKAEVVTTAAVQKVIMKKLTTKIATWSPRMGTNAPTNPIVPSVYKGNSLTVDGHKIMILGTKGILAHRPYLWIPDNKAVLGNVAIFGDMHLWMADTQTDESLNAWKAQLKDMQQLNPEVVIPGHMKAGTELNSATIKHSLNYIETFEQAKHASANSDELVKAMLKQYPADTTPISLSIGAKVHKGEMQW